MATAYAILLGEVEPEAIETEERYDDVSVRLAALLRKGSKRNAGETRLMKLLAVLIEDYDRRHGLPPDDSTPAELLRYLLERADQPASALASVFGQRSHINEALTGKRSISADQARKLGAMFNVSPGLFIR
jgi:HTH-type transcriptional regulator/antitoxin HigA